MKSVFVDRFSQLEELEHVIRTALEWVNIRDTISKSTRVFIKPNLTWRTPKPGVTVTPPFLRTLVENLLPLSQNITIGESEGGQSCFKAEDAFEHHGLYALQKEYGIGVVNLSKGQHELAVTTVANKRISIQLPSLLLHEMDVFITVPVPKIHAMTGVSLGFKNQWGCLGDRMRVNQHPIFNEAIVAINKLLKPRLCIFDGTYFLDYTGPIMGEPVRMNLVIAGDDVGAASLACCHIMGVAPLAIPHHEVARREGLFPIDFAGIRLNRSPGEFAGRKFRLRRAFINYIHLAAFKNRLLNRLFYDSPFADALHEFLWLIRRAPLVQRFLYGKYGPGEAKRSITRD